LPIELSSLAPATAHACKPLPVIVSNMKLSLIFLLLFTFGCKNNRKQEQVILPDFENEVTLTTKSKVEIPKGFLIDTIELSDKHNRLVTKIIFPISNIKVLDDLAKSELIRKRNDFTQELTEYIKKQNGEMSQFNSEFVAEPVSIFINDKIVSYCFFISDYFGGSSHPLDTYYSINYDIKSGKLISLSDYLKIKTKADTLYFTKLITKAINEESVSVKELNNQDFNIEKDSISFNYDNYEIASYALGTIRAKINTKEIKGRIKDDYR
jgi:hypothetical protein